MTPIEQLIRSLKIHRDTAFEKAEHFKSHDVEGLYKWYDFRLQTLDDVISFAEVQIEKEAIMTHDKILSMTDEFVQSNRGEGQTYAHYHYDMMADFALHILETFNTKER